MHDTNNNASLPMIANSDFSSSATIQVSALFCDKLTLTFVPTPTQCQTIADKVSELRGQGYAQNVWKPRYRTSVRFSVDPSGDAEGAMLLVQLEPKSPGWPYFRCEFNPAKADMREVRRFLDDVLPGGYGALMGHGICTRIDTTVDVTGAAVDDLLLLYPHFSKTSGHYKSGRTETFYLGTRESPKHLCIYDKHAEVSRENRKRLKKDPVPLNPTTRIEVRIRAKRSVSAMLDFPNPFAALKVASFERVSAKHERYWRLFLEAARSKGAQDAILMLPRQDRPRFKKLLATGACEWWHPDKLWQQWPTVLAGILNPPKFPCPALAQPSFSLGAHAA
jgi:hypothetical protein